MTKNKSDYSTPESKIELFVFGGQSNMTGYGGNAEKYPDTLQEYDRKIAFCWFAPGVSSSNGIWVKMQPQAGIFPVGHFGPEVTFARKLAQKGVPTAIFKYSLGSTSLAKNWLAPGESGIYDDMVAKLHDAITQLEARGATRIRVKALVWIQGESDAETSEMASGYHFRLQSLIRDFRNNVVRNSKLPVILGVDEQHPFVINNPIVLESHKQIAASDPYAEFVSMIGLPKADTSHLTPEGLSKHGSRLFAAYSNLVKKCS